MKQMMTVAGGVFFAITIMSLIAGSATFFQIAKFQNELENRSQFDKTVSQLTNYEELNKQKLKGMQDVIVTSFIIAGMSGFIGIGLAVTGKSKSTQN